MENRQITELIEEIKKINTVLEKITAAITVLEKITDAINEQSYLHKKQYNKINHDKRIDDILWK